jgi:KDO2-lipid IV(A) lauroyltransferase
MHSAWRRLRYWLEWFGLSLATRLVPLLPRAICLHLARFLGSVMFIFDRAGRKVALNNLEVALGPEFNESQRHRIARQSFQHFAQTMLDLLWSPRLTRENFRSYIELENFAETDTGPDRSFIIACYHYSNFEWLSHAFGFLDLTTTIIAQEFKNHRLDPIFRKLRQQSGHELISRERGIVRLYRVLRRKGRTALLVDVTVPPRKGAVAINCFGLKTSVTSAHAWLHQQTGAALIPAHCEPLPRGRYRVVFHRRIENAANMTPKEIAQACWDSFEPYVRKNPAPWLWMYKHWRYKPMTADRPYPFYAQSWNAFERVLASDRADAETAASPAPADAPVDNGPR